MSRPLLQVILASLLFLCISQASAQETDLDGHILGVDADEESIVEMARRSAP